MANDRTTPPTPFGAAALALDEELERFRKLADAACRAKLDARKDVERALRAVQAATESQEELNTRMRRFIEALQATRADNDRAAAELQRRRVELEARCAAMNELLGRFAKLGDAATEISAAARAITERARSDGPDVDAAAELTDIDARMAKVGDEARELAREAGDAGMSDLAVDIDAVRQQIAAARHRASILRGKLLQGAAPGEGGGTLN